MAWIAVAATGLALPVTAGADEGSGHDRCEAAAATDVDDCPAPNVTTAPAVASPAPAASPPLPTPPPATAFPTGLPAPAPLAPSGGTDPRPSLVAGAAVAAMAALVVSGFRARHRLRQAWDDDAPDRADV